MLASEMAFVYLHFPMTANPAGNETNSVGLKKKKKTGDILLIGKICMNYRAVISLPLWIRKCS